MLPPNPYYGMPMYAPQQQQTFCRCCSATAPAPNPTPTASSTLNEIAGVEGRFADLTVNDDSGKSDYSLFDDSYEPAGAK